MHENNNEDQTDVKKLYPIKVTVNLDNKIGVDGHLRKSPDEENIIASTNVAETVKLS